MESNPERSTEPSASTFSESSSEKKVDLTQRFLARFLDGLIAAVPYLFFTFLLPGFAGELLGALAAAAYVLFSDGLDVDYMRRRSLGKHLLGLRPQRLDGTSMTPEHSARRNWPLAVGYFGVLPFIGWLISLVSLGLVVYEIYKVVTDAQGRRWGDELAGTRVENAAAGTSSPFGSSPAG
jgi:uncharacterized RDD family membrane protein YckC